MDQDGPLINNSHFLRLWKRGQKHYALALIFQDKKKRLNLETVSGIHFLLGELDVKKSHLC